MPLPPQVVSHPLTVYLAIDGSIWAVDPSDGHAYQVNNSPSAGPPAGIPEAPKDGNLYGRENAAWAEVPPPPAAGIAEAPTDGQLYGRENAAWAVVSPSTGVQKTGDTMTGKLVVKGDQFDQSITPSPTPALMIENSAGGDQIGIAVGEFGDSITFVKANGTQANIRSQAILVMGTGTPNIQVSSGGINMSSPGGAHTTMYPMDDGSIYFRTGAAGAGLQLYDLAVQGAVHWDASGDLIVTQTTGPNAGKSVNLTAGKWA